MKERPILFSGPMVRAILEGRKTQTRRIVKFPETKRQVSGKEAEALGFYSLEGKTHGLVSPYGQPGDRLWVRETWTRFGDIISYKADEPVSGFKYDVKWRPSIHIPRWASRLLLEITALHIQRLQDISREDALYEGVRYSEAFGGYVTDDEGNNFHLSDPVQSFCKLWCSINGPESWDSNPWVWVISFEKINLKK